MKKLVLIEKLEQMDVVCDNPKCDYKERIEAKQLSTYLYKYCPICGEILLTDADYVNYQNMIKVIDFINRWFGWIAIFIKQSDKKKLVSVHHHDKVTTFKTIEK